MRTQESRQNGLESQQQSENGSRTLTPPAFQLQVSPVAPVQRQVPPGQEGHQQEGAGQEGFEGQDGGDGHVALGQHVNTVAPPEERVTPEWEAFARAFSHHFVAILPVFDPSVNVIGYSRDDHQRFANDTIGEDGNVVARQQPASAETAANPETQPEHQPAHPQQGGPQGRGGANSPNRGRTASNGRRGANANQQGRPGTQRNRRNQGDPANAETPRVSTSERHAPRTAPVASAAVLRHLFSDFHRTELMRYMRTRVIPPVLFNGGDLGNLSSGQRLALAAQILTYGTHERGDHLEMRRDRVDREVQRFREMITPRRPNQQRGRNAGAAHPAQQPAAQQPAAQPANAQQPANQNGAATPSEQQPQDVRNGINTQRVHGHNCGDWASYVTLYAGVRERLGAIGGAYNSFDHTGRLVLGTAEFSEVSGRETRPNGGTAVRGSELPTGNSAETNHIGPLEGAQAAEAQRVHQEYERQMADYQRELARNPNTTRRPPVDPSTRFGRHTQVTWASVMGIRTGDWLWIYNANSDTMGSHSVIFIRWIDASDRNADGADFKVRRALCFSQHGPETGGVEDNVLLGERYAAGAVPVTLIRHMEASNRHLTTEDLLPTQNAEVRQYWQDLNAAEMAALGRRRNVQRSFDRNAFVQFLNGRNETLIQQLADAVIHQAQSGAGQHVASEEQIATFRSANSTFTSQARGETPAAAQQGNGNVNTANPVSADNAAPQAQPETAQNAASQGQETHSAPASPAQAPTAPRRGRNARRTPPAFPHHATQADIGLRQLVMLYQRLVQVTQNAQVREQNIQNQTEGENRSGGLNRRHRRWEEEGAMRNALTPRERVIWDRQHQQGQRPQGQGQQRGRGGQPSTPPAPYGFSIPYGIRSSDMVVNGRILDAIPEAELMQFFTGADVPAAVPFPREVRGLIHRGGNGRQGGGAAGAGRGPAPHR